MTSFGCRFSVMNVARQDYLFNDMMHDHAIVDSRRMQKFDQFLTR